VFVKDVDLEAMTTSIFLNDDDDDDDDIINPRPAPDVIQWSIACFNLNGNC